MIIGKAIGSSQIAGAPQLSTPDADADHGQQTIEAGQRVHAAGAESGRRPPTAARRRLAAIPKWPHRRRPGLD
jgi:hypothetical protein